LIINTIFNIRYRYADDKESSGVVNICCHEIAGYLQLVQYAMQEDKNLIPSVALIHNALSTVPSELILIKLFLPAIE
jgi:hypothetical protein